MGEFSKNLHLDIDWMCNVVTGYRMQFEKMVEAKTLLDQSVMKTKQLQEQLDEFSELDDLYKRREMIAVEKDLENAKFEQEKKQKEYDEAYQNLRRYIWQNRRGINKIFKTEELMFLSNLNNEDVSLYFDIRKKDIEEMRGGIGESVTENTFKCIQLDEAIRHVKFFERPSVQRQMQALANTLDNYR